MKYLKKFTSINEAEGLRDADGDTFIDGMNEEDHILFPVIELLNNALQVNSSDHDAVMDNIDKALNLCYSMGNKFRYGRNEIDRVKTNQCSALSDCLDDLFNNVENGMEIPEVEKILHDIVVNCKLKYSDAEYHGEPNHDW